MFNSNHNYVIKPFDFEQKKWAKVIFGMLSIKCV